MNGPNVPWAIATAAVLQGAALYKARKANTWPAPRTELGIVTVGLIMMVITRIYPPLKWFAIIVMLSALAAAGK